MRTQASFFLKIFTELPVEECDRLGTFGRVRHQRRQDHPQPNEGDDAAARAEAAKRRSPGARSVRKRRCRRMNPTNPDRSAAADIGECISIRSADCDKSVWRARVKRQSVWITENGARYK